MDIVEQLDKLLSSMGYVKVADAGLDILDKSKTENCRATVGYAGYCYSDLSYELVVHESQQIIYPIAIYLHFLWCLNSDCIPTECRMIIEIIGEADNYSETLYKIDSYGCVYL